MNIANQEFKAREGPFPDRTVALVGVGDDGDVVRHLDAGAGEGAKTAARDVVVGEEDDVGQRAAMPFEPGPHDGVTGFGRFPGKLVVADEMFLVVTTCRGRGCGWGAGPVL